MRASICESVCAILGMQDARGTNSLGYANDLRVRLTWFLIECVIASYTIILATRDRLDQQLRSVAELPV